jgi:hypothetical protein
MINNGILKTKRKPQPKFKGEWFKVQVSSESLISLNLCYAYNNLLLSYLHTIDLLKRKTNQFTQPLTLNALLLSFQSTNGLTDD